MGGITEGVHDSGHIVRDTIVELHHIALRDAEVLSKSTITIYAYTDAVLANMLETTATVATMTTGDMSLTGNTVAHLDVTYTRTYLGYHAHILVTDGHGSLDGLLAPLVPLVDVEVGTTDGGLLDLDKHIVHTHFGHGNLFHPNALSGLLLN
jgi:hypothetical protein